MAKAMDVANFLIYLRNNDEDQGQYFSLSNLKLQKLLYYCQGGHYMWDDERLIDDAFFEAWDYGPVINEVYKSFKKFGQSDLYSDGPHGHLSEKEQDTIRAVWEQLKTNHAFDLVKSTHEEAPWLDARNNNQVFIPNADIRDFFQNQGEDVN